MRFPTTGIIVLAALSAFPAAADPNAGAPKPIFSCQLLSLLSQFVSDPKSIA